MSASGKARPAPRPRRRFPDLPQPLDIPAVAARSADRALETAASVRPLTTTRAPSRASASAIARPIPAVLPGPPLPCRPAPDSCVDARSMGRRPVPGIPQLPIGPVRHSKNLASLTEAIDIKRKMFFEFERARITPRRRRLETHRARRPDARPHQDRNLLTRLFSIARSSRRPVRRADPTTSRRRLYADRPGYHFMDQPPSTPSRSARRSSGGRHLLVDNVAIKSEETARRSGSSFGSRRAHRRVDRAGRPRRYGERQRHQTGHARTGWRSACLSSSRKASASVHSETRGSRGARNGAGRPGGAGLERPAHTPDCTGAHAEQQMLHGVFRLRPGFGGPP